MKKNNNDIVISFRCFSGDVDALKEISRTRSFELKRDIKYTDLIRESIKDTIKNYKLTHMVTNEEVFTNNIRVFAKERKLNVCRLYDVAHGKEQSHKLWICQEIIDPMEFPNSTI